jgi:hypothetical protein
MFSNEKDEGAACDAAAPSVVETAKPAEPVERSILRDFARQRDEARRRVTACEMTLASLEAVIETGGLASDAMRASIASDGGAALEALARGEPDPAMTRLVGAEMAARTATDALPGAKHALEEARAAAMRAEVEVVKAARNLLMVEAGKRGAEYRAAFATLGRFYDELIGISYGLPPTETLGQEIHNTVVGFEIPAFNTGGAYSVTMRHGPDERRVSAVQSRWTAAREALIENPDADYLAVLDRPHAPIAAIGSAPPGVIRGTNPQAADSHGEGVPVPGGITSAGFVETQNALPL